MKTTAHSVDDPRAAAGDFLNGWVRSGVDSYGPITVRPIPADSTGVVIDYHQPDGQRRIVYHRTGTPPPSAAAIDSPPAGPSRCPSCGSPEPLLDLDPSSGHTCPDPWHAVNRPGTAIPAPEPPTPPSEHLGQQLLWNGELPDEATIRIVAEPFGDGRPLTLYFTASNGELAVSIIPSAPQSFPSIPGGPIPGLSALVAYLMRLYGVDPGTVTVAVSEPDFDLDRVRFVIDIDRTPPPPGGGPCSTPAEILGLTLAEANLGLTVPDTSDGDAWPCWDCGAPFGPDDLDHACPGSGSPTDPLRIANGWPTTSSSSAPSDERLAVVALSVNGERTDLDTPVPIEARDRLRLVVDRPEPADPGRVQAGRPLSGDPDWIPGLVARGRHRCTPPDRPPAGATQWACPACSRLWDIRRHDDPTDTIADTGTGVLLAGPDGTRYWRAAWTRILGAPHGHWWALS